MHRISEWMELTLSAFKKIETERKFGERPSKIYWQILYKGKKIKLDAV